MDFIQSIYVRRKSGTAQHPGITRRRCNWIGFCDWIYFFCQSFLSNAVAVASLFFLFSVGFLINAIDVIFLLACLSSLTKDIYENDPLLSLSRPPLLPLSVSVSIPFSFSYCPTVRWFFFFFITRFLTQQSPMGREIYRLNFVTFWHPGLAVNFGGEWSFFFFFFFFFNFPKKLRSRKTGFRYGRLTI